MEDDQYFTYDARVASFQKTSKKRGSTVGGRGTKALNWPHKQIDPERLAKAGFYFRPTQTNPDNVECFLCEKSMDGWEAGDDPVEEHLAHSPQCGWAIVASIEAEVGDHGKQDPSHPDLVEARKATFAGRWPHEGKKGWKCKTKQLVEAGWKYTPTLESDDMATCTYCQLALDGWEPSDKPADEHRDRSPNCPFFALMSQSQGTKKKGARGKAARGSKASRLSVQSVATAISETASVADLTAEPEDSVMTTASTMTQGGKKGRAKKANVGKGSKSKAKAQEPLDSEMIEEPVKHDTAKSSLPPKVTRGKKRGSEAVDDSVVSVAEAPAPKRRATKTRGSTATVDSSVITQDDSQMTDVPPSKKSVGRKKGRASNTKATRKASGAASTVASMASLRAPPEIFPDDDEIERQLEADLARQYSDDEEMTFETAAEKNSNYAMFAPDAVVPNEDAVDDELKALEAEMQVDQQEQLKVPKKGRKAGTRKASKQTKPKKVKAPSPPPDEAPEAFEPEVFEPEPELEPQQEIEDEKDISIGSTDTVVKTVEPADAGASKRGRGRPPKVSLSSVTSQNSVEAVEVMEAPEEPELPTKRGRGRPSKISMGSQALTGFGEAPANRGRGRPSKQSLASQTSIVTSSSKVADAPAKKARGRPKKVVEATKRVVEANMSDELDELQSPEPTERDTSKSIITAISQLAQPSTPSKVMSPMPPSRQAAISPSQSPQSSDAENQPPSSKPAGSSATKRIVLAPMTATPVRISPSKRNVLAGLQSTTPWTAANLEMVLGSPRNGGNKENDAERFLMQGKDLTSPEKRMTVEEWIYHNASEAEKKLKYECETMISKFENEGSRAMRVLEGLAVD